MKTGDVALIPKRGEKVNSRNKLPRLDPFRGGNASMERLFLLLFKTVFSYVYGYFACLYVCASCAWLVPLEARGGCGIP